MSTVGFQSLFSLPYFESVLNYLGHFRRQMAVFCDISGDVPSNENSSKTAQNSARIQKIRMNCHRVIFEKNTVYQISVRKTDHSYATVYCAPVLRVEKIFVDNMGRYEDRSNNFVFQKEHYYRPRRKVR